jgi:hypothetical protein
MFRALQNTGYGRLATRPEAEKRAELDKTLLNTRYNILLLLPLPLPPFMNYVIWLVTIHNKVCN